MICQKVLKFFFSVRDFFTNFGLREVKKLLNSLAVFCEFCIVVLPTLIIRDGRFDFVFCFPVISFMTFHVRLECFLGLPMF